MDASSERDRRPDRRATLYRLSARLFGTYLLLYGMHASGVLHVRSLLELDLFLFGALLLTVPLLAFDIDAGNLPERVERGFQYVFLAAALALAIALSSAPSLLSGFSLPGVRTVLRSNSSALLVVAICTGVLTAVSVRTNELDAESPIPDRCCRVFGRSVSLRKSVALLCLVAILGFYVAIRSPFVADTFGGVIHGDKYATHVPIVQEMYRTGDPLHFRNAAYASMSDPTAHVYDSYGKVPVFVWGILPLMPLEPLQGLEVVVRSFTTVLGLLLLLTLFAFLRELFDVTIAIAGTLLFAGNPMFTLVSYLTVMDLPALVFGFASIVLYWRDEKTYSYLLCGMAALTKYSFLLIAVPILAVLILLNESEKFYNAIELGYFALVPIVLFNVLVVPIPGDSPIVGFLRVSVFLLLLGASTFVFERYGVEFAGTVSKIDREVRYSLMAMVPVLGIALLWNLITRFASGFLTDRYLVFNADVYAAMLALIREQMPDVVFYLFPVGVLWFLLSGDRRQRTTIVALICGAVCYAVVASKSVFIHTYYKHVPVFVGIIGFLGVLDAVRRAEISRRIALPAAMALILLLGVSSQAASVALLSDDIGGTEAMGEYIDENVADSELVLYTQPHGRLMAIYSGAKLTDVPEGRERAALESEIRERGLGSALLSRNVGYYLSRGPADFDDVEASFADSNPSDDRRNAILDEVHSRDSSGPTADLDDAPNESFELDARFGDWYLYRVHP